jgi:hypothetical protein
VAGETLLQPSRACFYEPHCRYRAKIKLDWGRKSFCGRHCGFDVGDRHGGVAESPMSGERLCMMRDGRRDLAGV